MKFSKRYLVFALAIVLILFGKLNKWNDRYAAVESFRGATLKDEVFYPLISKNINDCGALGVSINGERYNNKLNPVLLDATLQPVVSLDFIKDTLHGSVYRADSVSVVMNVAGNTYEFLLGNATATLNGDDVDLKVIPSEYNGQVYLGFEDLCNIFGYGYLYDSSAQRIDVMIEKYPKLPQKFDLRKCNKVSQIRNQGSNSTCWACASLETLESTLMPYEKYVFSVESMLSDNSFDLSKKDAGDYTMALAYLTAWQGPKLENVGNIIGELTHTTNEKTIHLQEAHFYDAENLDDIKSAVFRYGGVSTSIYANVSNSNLSTSNCYNRKTNSYCYRGNNEPNHDVVIVGWDDNFESENFNENIPGDGAFICQNSWGDSFGDAGVFYISYYDTNIGKQSVSYSKVDTSGKYNYIYQSDLCGWVGQIGYQKEWAYGANVFTASEHQQIESAGFYALTPQTEYQLYFVSNYENAGSFGKRRMVAEGVFEDAGYYTVAFDFPIEVQPDEEFAVVLYINSPNTTRPLAIEYADDHLKAAVDIEDGKGYISNNGLDWERVEDVASANLCIKAYGNKIVEVFE